MNKNSSDLDLFLMSHCKNFIIANSTFSWWAAIISKNKKKSPLLHENGSKIKMIMKTIN